MGAVEEFLTEIARLFLAGLPAKDKSVRTALPRAVNRRWPDMVRELLEAGAAPDADALAAAAVNGDLESARHLLARGAPREKALASANLRKGNEQMIRLLSTP